MSAQRRAGERYWREVSASRIKLVRRGVCIEITEPKRGSKTTVYPSFSPVVIYESRKTLEGRSLIFIKRV